MVNDRLICPNCGSKMEQAEPQPNIPFDIFPGTTDSTSSSSVLFSTSTIVTTPDSATNFLDDRSRPKIIINTYICPKCNFKKQIKE